MKIGKILQITGVILFATGFIARIGYKLFLETDFSSHSEDFQLLKFLGFVCWGVGYVIHETSKKSKGKLKDTKKNPSKI